MKDLENRASTGEQEQLAPRFSLSAHTPGPWIVTRGTRGKLCVVSESTWICGELEADNHTRIEPETCIANARLIAAAPELLEELKRAYKFIALAPRNFDIERLLAVIAKATSHS